MGFTPRDFESRASANSATSAEYGVSISRFRPSVNGKCARLAPLLMRVWMRAN